MAPNTPSMSDVQKAIQEVVDEVTILALEQDAKLQKLNPTYDPKNPDHAAEAIQASADFVKKLVEQAFNEAVVTQLKNEVIALVLTGRSKTQKNPVAVA